MALLVRKIGELDEVNALLRGGIFCGRSLLESPTYGLDGKTLVFNSPGATVTFATTLPGPQQALTIKQIIDQINAVPTLAGYASAFEGRLFIIDPAAATAVELDNTGTANAILGFDPAGVAGEIYNAPGGAPPALVDITPMQQVSGGYLVTTDEV